MANESAAAVEEKPADGEAKTSDTILDGAKAQPDKSADSPEAKAAADAKAKADASSKAATDAAKPADDKKPAQDGKPADDKPKGAPEKYEPFKVPEGVPFDEKAQAKIAPLFKELGLTQEGGQKLVDFQASVIKDSLATQKADFDKMQTEWADQTKKELGKDADKELAFAAQARDKFATPGLRTILNKSGLGNHPEFVKLFITLGKAISEDSFESGKPATDNAGKSAADIIYPNQGK